MLMFFSSYCQKFGDANVFQYRVRVIGYFVMPTEKQQINVRAISEKVSGRELWVVEDFVFGLHLLRQAKAFRKKHLCLTPGIGRAVFRLLNRSCRFCFLFCCVICN